MWRIKKFEELTALELYQVIQARVEIFVVEQNCPYQECDGFDQLSFHAFKEEKGEVIAYFRILPKETKYKETSIGRVIVKKQYRGKGIGKELMTNAIDFIHHELKETSIRIQAQEYLRDFYCSFGFQPISSVYLEDNIPHLDMIYSI